MAPGGAGSPIFTYARYLAVCRASRKRQARSCEPRAKERVRTKGKDTCRAHEVEPAVERVALEASPPGLQSLGGGLFPEFGK